MSVIVSPVAFMMVITIIMVSVSMLIPTFAAFVFPAVGEGCSDPEDPDKGCSQANFHNSVIHVFSHLCVYHLDESDVESVYIMGCKHGG